MSAMEERIRPTRSGLFSIELLISVGIFVFCAAVCTGIFVRAELMSRESEELNVAVNEARSLAECFQAAGGNLDRIGTYLYTYSDTYSVGRSDSVTADGTLSDGVAADSVIDGGVLILRREGLVLRLTPVEAEHGADCPEAALTVSSGDRTLLEWTIAALPDRNTAGTAGTANADTADMTTVNTVTSDAATVNTDTLNAGGFPVDTGNADSLEAAR